MHQFLNIKRTTFTTELYNFVRRQQLKYFGHNTRHNGLEKTIMQGMEQGKKQRKAKTKMEERHHHIFNTVAMDRYKFCKDIWTATC